MVASRIISIITRGSATGPMNTVTLVRAYSMRKFHCKAKYLNEIRPKCSLLSAQCMRKKCG